MLTIGGRLGGGNTFNVIVTWSQPEIPWHTDTIITFTPLNPVLGVNVIQFAKASTNKTPFTVPLTIVLWWGRRLHQIRLNKLLEKYYMVC